MTRPGGDLALRVPNQSYRANRHESLRPAADPDLSRRPVALRSRRCDARRPGRLRARVLPRVGESGRLRGDLREEPRPALAARPVLGRTPAPSRATPTPTTPTGPRPRPTTSATEALSPVPQWPDNRLIVPRGDRLPRHARGLAREQPERKQRKQDADAVDDTPASPPTPPAPAATSPFNPPRDARRLARLSAQSRRANALPLRPIPSSESDADTTRFRSYPAPRNPREPCLRHRIRGQTRRADDANTW